jgi:hypothetical protein
MTLSRFDAMVAVSRLKDMPLPVVIQGPRRDSSPGFPAVIVNPMTDSEALMAWSVEQLTAVNRLLAALAVPGASDEGAALAAAIAHFTAQAEAALREALQIHRDSFLD